MHHPVRWKALQGSDHLLVADLVKIAVEVANRAKFLRRIQADSTSGCSFLIVSSGATGTASTNSFGWQQQLETRYPTEFQAKADFDTTKEVVRNQLRALAAQNDAERRSLGIPAVVPTTKIPEAWD